MKFSNPISERLDYFLKKRGMSAYELCKRTGYAEGKVSVPKKRKNAFTSATMLYKFAQVLGITSDELISGSPPVPDSERVDHLRKELDNWKSKYESLQQDLKSLKININKINN